MEFEQVGTSMELVAMEPVRGDIDKGGAVK